MLNGKFECTHAEPCWSMTVGKVYKFKNGVVKWDNGMLSYVYKDLDEFYKYNSGLKIRKVKS